AAVTVEAIDAIAFVNGWGADPGPTLIAGKANRFWVELFHGGHGLAGHGATTFSYTGPLAAATLAEVPANYIPGTEEHFAVGTQAGQATLTATSGAATAVLPITILDAGAVTGAQMSVACLPGNSRGTLMVTPAAGSKAVYGPTCTWMTDGTVK